MGQSKLRPFLQKANPWIEADDEALINDCVDEVVAFVESVSIKPADKKKVLKRLEDEFRWTEEEDIPPATNATRKQELVRYLYNSVCIFEGDGVVK